MSFKARSFYLTVPNPQVQQMFVDKGHRVAYMPEHADVIVFPGGHDVIPILYGERPIQSTAYSLGRDLREVRIFRTTPHNKPKVGICRGAQFLNVMCGGALYQDVNNHCTDHDLMDVASKRLFKVTSTHHQMMIPPNHAKILGLAAEATRKETEATVTNLPSGQPLPFTDPEVVWFKHQQCLCFQPHPEYERAETCRNYFFELLDKYIFPRIQSPEARS
jgi:GMP synthase-like glutamine amidotransferase